MSRALLILANDEVRKRAERWVKAAPVGTRVEFKAPRRSPDQNSMLWLWLTAIASQLDWHGQKYSTEDWKDYLMHSFKRARWMPDEEGGMVPIGMRTSDLTKQEMADLLELCMAFGASHGVDIPPMEQEQDGIRSRHAS